MKINLKERLLNQLTSYIQTLPANEKLLSERQLADKYEVSRNTVRCVLLQLEMTGIIRRIHGKGTFVNRMDLNADLASSYKFGQQMLALGKNPATKVISFEVKEANAYFIQNMDLKQGDLVIQVDRLRLADDEPMMFERTFLPKKIFPTLTPEMLQKRSMYDIFQEDFDEKIDYADEYFSAGVISSGDAGFMGLADGTPCLRLKRTTYDEKHQIIEFTLSIARSDEFAYHVRHQIED